MQFRPDQIALAPKDPEAAIALLTKMGAAEWARDHVTAEGRVFGKDARNEANLAFNYEMLANGCARELEVLEYTAGNNWMLYHPPGVSHLGMHCTAEELVQWREFFADEGFVVAQEVETIEHTNPVIAGKRWYQYVIFATRHVLGVDVKFIVRRTSL
jgi:hypothetical protein